MFLRVRFEYWIEPGVTSSQARAEHGLRHPLTYTSYWLEEQLKEMLRR